MDIGEGSVVSEAYNRVLANVNSTRIGLVATGTAIVVSFGTKNGLEQRAEHRDSTKKLLERWWFRRDCQLRRK